jgi:membrane protease subunit (stomatin/prohibitin family)
MNKKLYITIASFLVLSIVVMSVVNTIINKKNTQIEVYKSQMETSKLVIKNLEKEIEVKELQLDTLKIEFLTYIHELDGLVIEKEIIKIEYVDKIKTINSKSTSELDEFFSRRLN